MLRESNGTDVKSTRREHAYRHIRGRMLEGSLRAGARLSPTALAREIGTSHIPVREAISQLQSEGLVIHTPHRGAFVRELARHDLIDLVEIRSILECRAAALAARRITPSQLNELKDAYEAMCRLTKQICVYRDPDADPRDLLQQFCLSDMLFHMALVCAARNRHVIRIIQDLRIMTQMFGYRTDPPKAWTAHETYWRRNLQSHTDVFDAVSRRDAKAAYRAMSVHMRISRKNCLNRFDWLQRHGDVDSSLAKDFPDSVRDLILTIQQRKFAGDLAGADAPSD